MSNRTFSHILTLLALASAPFPAMAQRPQEGQELMAAVKNGDGATAMQLLGVNPTLVNTRDFSGQTPLLAALEQGNEDWVGFLIEKGADVNAADKNGDTPLIIATRRRSDVAIGWLLEKGAKPDLNNKIGETALILAVQTRNLAAAKRLLAAGASPDKADYSGHSARDYAKRDDRTPAMLKLIETAKAKP